MYATMLWMSLRFPLTYKPLVVYRFYCLVLFHSQTQRHMIKLGIDKSNLSQVCYRYFKDPRQ